MTHQDDCGWHVDQFPFECTCGAITDADLLRAQVLGEAVPVRPARTCKWVHGCVDRAKCAGLAKCGGLDPIDREPRDPWAGHERDPMRLLPPGTVPRAHAQFKLREAGQ